MMQATGHHDGVLLLPLLSPDSARQPHNAERSHRPLDRVMLGVACREDHWLVRNHENTDEPVEMAITFV
jgi:hypothetical protein